VVIQQDGAKCHIKETDAEFLAAGSSGYWHIDEMIEMVVAAYGNFESIKMEKGFITLAICIDQVLSIAGDNDYKIPHLYKDKLIREGTPPKQYRATEKALERAQELLDLEEEAELEDLACLLEEWEEEEDQEEELVSLLMQWEEEENGEYQHVLEWCEEEEIQDLALYVEENYG
jgi:hypothetical protein